MLFAEDMLGTWHKSAEKYCRIVYGHLVFAVSNVMMGGCDIMRFY